MNELHSFLILSYSSASLAQGNFGEAIEIDKLQMSSE